MKTLDRNYLATHPAGDEKATLTLSQPVAAAVEVPDNPDGTRPKVSLRVTGNTYQEAIAALTDLHDLGADELIAVMLTYVVTDEELDRFASVEDAGPFLSERVRQVTVPFHTFEAAGELPDGSTVEIAITAPSVAAAVEHTLSATHPRALSSLAVALCPVIDDEDGAEDEVLVVS